MYAKSTRPSAKRDDQIARPRRAQACEAGRFFYNKLIEEKKLWMHELCETFSEALISSISFHVSCIIIQIV